MVLVAGEAAVPLVRAQPPGRLAAAGSATVTILLGDDGRGRVGAAGGRPAPTQTLLHLVYALLAFGLVPLAESLMAQANPRRQAAARLVGALVGWR